MAGFRLVDVDVPSLGGKRKLRSPSAGGSLRFKELQRREKAGENVEVDFICEALATCLVDENGKRVFADRAAALTALDDVPLEEFKALHDQLVKHVAQHDLKETPPAGNSVAGPSAS